MRPVTTDDRPEFVPPAERVDVAIDAAPGVAPASPLRGERRRKALAGAAVAVAVAAGVALRFTAHSELWLDEALSVHIAELPLSEIPEALRHDGAPPLYYLLLHGWMKLFGASDLAVRSLGAVFSVAALPLAWMAARRIGDRRTAWAAVVILATSPFAIAYASQARMYSLVVLLAFAGFLALSRFLERPSVASGAALAAVTGLLALTHYWCFYLIAAVLAVLGVRFLATSGAARRHTLLAAVTMCSGGILFLPWLRSFVYQIRYTGTPWAPPGRFTAVFDSIMEFAGGPDEAGRALLVVLLALAAMALFARPLDDRYVEIDLRTRPEARPLAAVTVLTLSLGVGAGLVVGSAFAFRYASVALAPFLLLAALGVRALASAKVRHSVLAIAAVTGLLGGLQAATEQRTQAPEIAEALRARAEPGDVVAFCPDQLGPAVARLLPRDRYRQLSFPRGNSPRRVDWVQYEAHQAAANPTEFAERLDRMAGDSNSVWLVWAPGYRTFEDYCQIIDRDVGDMRPAADIAVGWAPHRYGEASGLIEYPPECRRPLARRHDPAAPGCPVRTVFP